jgi:DNA modification methylase
MGMTQIRPQVKNANRHTARGMQALETSLANDGWIGAITVAADGETFDGSARVEKTAENGMLDDAIVVDSDGTRPIVVRRTDIPTATDERAVRLGIAANRVASLNLDWEPDVLTGIAASGVDLSSLFTADEWADVSMPALPDAGAGGDEFNTEPLDGPTRTALGELWQIGPHRLLVADCTVAANVARLMGGERAALCFTSPPYNVAAESSLPNKNKYRADRQKYSDDQPDNRSEQEYLQLVSLFTALAIEHSEYVFVNVQSVAGNKVALIDYLHAFKEQYADTIIWDKLTAEPAMAHNVVNSRFEYVHVFSHKANRAIENVYSLNSRQNKEFSDIHRATFPLEFPQFFVEQFTNAGELVLDPFWGTGTTLIAAHRTGRRCYGMEIAPRYADVILRRAEAEGLECELIPYTP